LHELAQLQTLLPDGVYTPVVRMRWKAKDIAASPEGPGAALSGGAPIIVGTRWGEPNQLRWTRTQPR